MRRLCLLAAALGSLLAAAPAGAAGTLQYHSTFRGSGASAFFAGLAPGALPQPGVTYTDTSVYAANDATLADGARYRDDAVYLNQFSYRYDEAGTFVPVAASYGVAHGAAVTLKVGGDLGSASVAATVPVTRCEIDPATWATSCADAGSRSVAVAWAGAGDVSRGTSHSTWSSGGSRYVSRFTGAWRPAGATGTLDGGDLGASTYGSIYNTSGMSLDICHGC
jgi:hypothetical protein